MPAARWIERGGAGRQSAARNSSAIPLIGWSLWRLVQDGVPHRRSRAPLALLAVFLVGIALLQLVPLPPTIWTHLPGRGPIVAGYGLLGARLPWLPLTLAPDNALASLLWLLPAFATLLAITVLGAFRARWIALVLIGVTLTSVMVGTLQLIGGADSPLYFYEMTNPGVGVGFFANANHNATLMLDCIPFLAAYQATLLKRSSSPRSASAIRLVVAALFAVIAVGLVINGSLAGIGIGVPVAMISLVVFGRQRPSIRGGLVLATTVISIAAIAFIVIGPFGNNLIGKQQDNVELSRQTSFTLTLRAARAYLPFGSGIGSFQPIYRTQEPLATIGRTYMNHAHSDWIELLLETGLVGIGLILLFLFWSFRRARGIWSAEDKEPFAQAAVIATAAMMLHSIVDYPLRTAALSAVFAACIGLISGMRPYVRLSRSATSARHLNL